MKAHKDLIKKDKKSLGYSIRMGKKVPVNSVNLAYMHTKPVSPENNLFIEDRASLIHENGLSHYREKEIVTYPNDEFLLSSKEGQSIFPTSDILITDEFTIKKNVQEEQSPLFFRTELKDLFNAKGSFVMPYVSGITNKLNSEGLLYEDLTEQEKEELIYLGELINIQEENSSLTNENIKYKIKLIQEGESSLYRVVIYTNFRNSTNKTYKVHYTATINDKLKIKEEVLNAYPFFERISYEELIKKGNSQNENELSIKQYAIKEDGDNFNVYATSQVAIANMETRRPQSFKYRTEAKLSTRLNETNKGQLKIGVIYLNKSVFGVENLSGVSRILEQNKFKPSYLEIINPHPYERGLDKSNLEYWLVNLDMPSHHYFDYDILILTGYGQNDLTPYRDYLEDYLSEGGVLWIDNGGEVTIENNVVTKRNSLSFVVNDRNTLFTNLDFSKDSNSTGTKIFSIEDSLKNRLYNLNQNLTNFGYQGVSPKIVFGTGERKENWKTHISYGTNEPAVISKSFYEKGKVFVSNCGVLRSVYHSEEVSSKFIFNLLLSEVEQKWFATPWKNNYVYHKDNLFLSEYKDSLGNDIYLDDRSDYDETKIVAKKILGKTSKEELIPYLPKWYQNNTGVYSVVVDNNQSIAVKNNEFESFGLDSSGNQIKEWTNTTKEAIPGWDTVKFSGSTAVFNHLYDTSENNSMVVSIKTSGTNGARAYWESEPISLNANSYELTSWIKTKINTPITNGFKIAIYDDKGVKIVSSIGVVDTRNWIRIAANFNLKETKLITIRIGLIDSNEVGEAVFDSVEITSKGNVAATPENTGISPVYAYAIESKGENLDIASQGYFEENISRYYPEVDYKLIVRSFVYRWINETGRYQKEYGNFSTYDLSISKSEGKKTIGFLQSYLPPLKGGAEWEDKNKVYYEVISVNPDGSENQLIDLSIYNNQTSDEYFLKNGELVISYMDLFWAQISSPIMLQVKTNYETVRASKRFFGIRLKENNNIYVKAPMTKDNKESWFLRISNGSFSKKELGHEEWSAIQNNKSQIEVYEKRNLLVNKYSIPEYRNQAFNPTEGIRTVENQVEFLNNRSIKLPHENLVTLIGKANKETLNQIGDSRKVFEAENENWNEREDVLVFVDRLGTGNTLRIYEGFDIDYKKGIVSFEEDVLGDVEVSYSYKNLRVFKREYGNGKISNEILTSEDRKTFRMKKEFLLFEPAIVIKNKFKDANGKFITSIVPQNSYTINYEKGLIVFDSDQYETMYADYSYYVQTELEVEDWDALNGIVYLKNTIDFKDDIYAIYSYEENFYEYKGYYDEKINQFMYLDLNPSVGHFSTLPAIEATDIGDIVKYKYLPSSQLLNKEIFIYILPNENTTSIKHCFSNKEWNKLKESNPLALLLAKVFVREHTDVEQVTVLDARTRGGGITESISEKEIEERVSGKQRYWDIGGWNGKTYYRNGTLVVELPKEILESHGGNFNEEGVMEVLNKYVAYGTYIITEYV